MRAAETAAVMGFLAIEPLGAWAVRAVLCVVIVFPGSYPIVMEAVDYYSPVSRKLSFHPGK
jgi:hypothetical protein